jgi:hypothetical protein
MPGKTRGGSRAQHAKAGRQSHKNDDKSRNPRGGHSTKQPRRETAEAEARPSGKSEEMEENEEEE